MGVDHIAARPPRRAHSVRSAVALRGRWAVPPNLMPRVGRNPWTRQPSVTIRPDRLVLRRGRPSGPASTFFSCCTGRALPVRIRRVGDFGRRPLPWALDHEGEENADCGLAGSGCDAVERVVVRWRPRPAAGHDGGGVRRWDNDHGDSSVGRRLSAPPMSFQGRHVTRGGRVFTVVQAEGETRIVEDVGNGVLIEVASRTLDTEALLDIAETVTYDPVRDQ